MFKKVVIMTGAGISTSAGVPDFRSPAGRHFHDLKKYDLPSPEAIFDLQYFKKKPEPFYALAKDYLDLDKYSPTPCHHFANMVHAKQMASHYLTENIDNLESKAGFAPDDVIHANGANIGAACSDQRCTQKASRRKYEKCVRAGKVMRCKACGKPIKPEILFYGEGDNRRFREVVKELGGQQCDLLIVIGSDLEYSPFNTVLDVVGGECPKVLIHTHDTSSEGYDFCDQEKFPNNLFLQGDCDEVVTKLAKDCGWDDEFSKMGSPTSKPDQLDVDYELLNKMKNLGLKANDEKIEIGTNELRILKEHLAEAREYNEPHLRALVIGSPSISMDSVVSCLLMSLVLKESGQYYTPVLNCKRIELKCRIDVAKHLGNFGIDQDFLSENVIFAEELPDMETAKVESVALVDFNEIN